MVNNKFPLLEIESLHLQFSTPQTLVSAVRGVSFTIDKGESVGLIGESGCGKSSLARAVGQVGLPRNCQIQADRLALLGQDLLTLRESALCSIRGSQIGLIGQDSLSSLNPTMPIGKQVIEGLRYHQPACARSEAKRRGLALLKEVGLPDPQSIYHRFPHQLSGGQRQRIIIAINMIVSPSLLIADEPTTALDVTTQAQIIALIKQLQNKTGMGLLLITHDLSLVANSCERAMVMYAGQIVEMGPTEQIFTAPQHPYTQALLRAQNQLTACLETGEKGTLFVISGSPPKLDQTSPGCPFQMRCPYRQAICLDRTPSLQPTSSSDSDLVACHLSAEERRGAS